MNTALQSAGSGWHYVLNGALPTLEEKNKPSGGIPVPSEKGIFER